jgi:hypothetical protein
MNYPDAEGWFSSVFGCCRRSVAGSLQYSELSFEQAPHPFFDGRARVDKGWFYGASKCSIGHRSSEKAPRRRDNPIH